MWQSFDIIIPLTGCTRIFDLRTPTLLCRSHEHSVPGNHWENDWTCNKLSVQVRCDKHQPLLQYPGTLPACSAQPYVLPGVFRENITQSSDVPVLPSWLASLFDLFHLLSMAALSSYPVAATSHSSRKRSLRQRLFTASRKQRQAELTVNLAPASDQAQPFDQSSTSSMWNSLHTVENIDSTAICQVT